MRTMAESSDTPKRRRPRRGVPQVSRQRHRSLWARASRKAGLPPGTPVHVGPERDEPVGVTAFAYGPDDLVERPVDDLDRCGEMRDGAPVVWTNVDGVHDVERVQQVGRAFGLHPLVVEDIVNTTQRPKAEEYDGTLFLVVRMLNWDDAAGGVRSEQVSFVLGRGFLLSFQEREGDVFGVIRERLRSGAGQVRKMGPDYLLYALLDAIVDQYFLVLERIGERLEELEEGQLQTPRPEDLQEIRRLKREMVVLRRAAWPLRDALGSLERAGSELVSAETAIYLRDVHDHTVQVIETAETYRDLLAGAVDLHLSAVSFRTNEVMKVLTIIATIFIPLTFIAGIYGMNFSPEASPYNMPELQWRYGYFASLAAMVLVTLAMLYYFRRKRWL